MDTRKWLSAALAAIVVGAASIGASLATAGPEQTASTTALAADSKQAPPTPTPTRLPAPSSVGDDLIYDFVGPSNAEPGMRAR